MDQTKFEILKIARDIAVNEYANTKAQKHNQWLVDSENHWNTYRTKLAYPPIPRYPTENDIIAKTQTLFDFLDGKTVVDSHEEPITVPESTIEQGIIEESTVAESTEIAEESSQSIPDESVQESVSPRDILSNPEYIRDFVRASVRNESSDYGTSASRVIPSILSSMK